MTASGQRDITRKHCGILARGNEIRNRDGAITKKGRTHEGLVKM